MKKIIKKIYKIDAPIKKVWKALVDTEIIDKWGGGPSKMNAEIGTEFSLWNGDIHGKNVEIVSEKKLVQEWFAWDWAKPSIVTFVLKSECNKTVLELEHVNVPADEFEDIDQVGMTIMLVQ